MNRAGRIIIATLVAFVLLEATGCDLAGPSSDDGVSTPTSTVVSIAAISGVTAPVFGAAPVTSITETAQYTGSVAWSPTATTFSSGTVYTATITLTAKTGYTLTGVTVDFFTVAGSTTDSNPVNSGVVTAVFPAAPLLTMISVPSGTFQRDATATNLSTVSAFRMSQTEITRAQFAEIMGTDPAAGSTASSGTSAPVAGANWYHAIAFCNKLSLAEGLTPVYAVTGVDFSALTFSDIPTRVDNSTWNAATPTWTNNGYRLPTEMEWMWAAMGATSDRSNGYTGTGTNTTGYTKGYAGSTETAGAQANLGDYAWSTLNSDATSHPAGTKNANELGLYDMSGNVAELTWDWYGTHPFGTLTDYRGAASGTFRVGGRGGSYADIADRCKFTYRAQYSQYMPYSNFGFRVVRGL